MSTEKDSKTPYRQNEEEKLNLPDDDAANPYTPKTNDRPVFTFIHQHYGVASKLGEETTMMTTSMILQKIVEHTGDASITLNEVYEWLKNNGYQQAPLTDMEIYWLLKEID